MQVVTKSDMVVRDIDLLARMDAAAAITITTMNESVSRRLRPGAPPPARRLEAVKRLSENGVPASVRIDPIIPGINDLEIEDLVLAASSAGARHITTSTYKARPASLKAICRAFPEAKSPWKLSFAGAIADQAACTSLGRQGGGLTSGGGADSSAGGITFAACREGTTTTSRWGEVRRFAYHYAKILIEIAS